jgi:hypothetical protein
MNHDITLMDIFYTGSMIFAAFYGALLITKLLAKDAEDDEKADEEK